MAPHEQSDEDPFGRDYWEERYSAPGFAWSGNANPVLVAEATPLTPGRALDIGSGEGGDAIWLASRGWQVTAVDIAQSALDKARSRAEEADADAASRIIWEQHDITAWTPEARSFDLISSQFMHLADPERTTLFRALANAVAPGGTLLIVGHELSEAEAGEHAGHRPELMFNADDVAKAIGGTGLTVISAESRGREHADRFHRDVVVLARR